MDLQIEDFYKDVAGGLLMLYQAFPRKTALYVEDLIGHEEPDEFGLPSKRHQGCLGALLWLADEGYVRFESTIQFQAIDQAVLTEKAFLRLTGSVAGTKIGAGDLPRASCACRQASPSSSEKPCAMVMASSWHASSACCSRVSCRPLPNKRHSLK